MDEKATKLGTTIEELKRNLRSDDFLRTVCAEMGIAFEEISADEEGDAVRNLIDYCGQAGRSRKLVRTVELELEQLKKRMLKLKMALKSESSYVKYMEKKLENMWGFEELDYLWNQELDSARNRTRKLEYMRDQEQD